MGTVEDRKLRRLLFIRITDRLAELYRAQVSGDEWEGRLVQLTTCCTTGGSRPRSPRMPAWPIPILRQHSCPYYELAEADRAICALERKMFEKVLGRGLRLSQCRLDGDRFCDFEAKPHVADVMPRATVPPRLTNEDDQTDEQGPFDREPARRDRRQGDPARRGPDDPPGRGARA